MGVAARLVGLVALIGIGAALWRLETADAGLDRRTVSVGETPVTVTSRPGERGPAVVIAHGFAGSRQLMDAFAVTLARADYAAVSFDFLGHGRHPRPMTGDVTSEEGATRRLLEQLGAVIAFAKGIPEADGRAALLGHSMATDIIARAAAERDDIAATVAVSMGPFTVEDVITPEAPRNLLVVTGEWEAGLIPAALRAAGMVAEGAPEPGRTYGSHEAGTARRAVIAPEAEHLSVLYDRVTLEESVAWLDAAFGRPPSEARPDLRGPWLVMLFAGLGALAWPLSKRLPRIAPPPPRAGRWRPFLARAAVPAVLTPLILWPVPTGFLPVLVADYLALHFAVYGAILGAILLRDRGWRAPPFPSRRTILAGLAVALYTVLAIALAIDAYFTAYLPHAGRWPVILALLPGIALYMLADEAMTRAPSAPRGAYPATKLLFLLSLAAAVALDLEDLFFLIIILPLMLAFFLVYGLFSGWVWRATGSPVPAGLANAMAFALALGVTFPLFAG